jgi:hypothetical protein
MTQQEALSRATVWSPTTQRWSNDPALEEIRLLDVKDLCKTDPKALINEIHAIDTETGDEFDFNMFEPDKPWYWQSGLIDWWMTGSAFLILKARQLGVTWCACAFGLWYLLFVPGTAVLAFSYTEEEAKILAAKTWLMYNSLPEVLRNHVKVVTPGRAEEPSEWIRLRHANGKLSTFRALPATKKHGRGGSAALIIGDELAYQDYAREIYTSAQPTISKGGKFLGISTANGVANKETGEGNFFSHLYQTKEQKGLKFKFLPWNLHPLRDEKWYDTVARRLDEVERNREYPLNELDAFMLSGSLYFNRDSLAYYRANVKEPIDRGQFVRRGVKGEWMKLKDGVVNVYERPSKFGRYAIGVDTASGKGSDYTVGTVIDLSSGAIVATLRGKLEAARAAFQLHHLGTWYNEALICVERQGGNGEAVLMALREGSRFERVYKKLYQHTRFTSAKQPISQDYGHPMGPQARLQVLDNLKTNIRDRLFPWMPESHMEELGTFVYRDKNPSPAADEGNNDDCVMSLALAAEMYRQKGDNPQKQSPVVRRRRTRRQPYSPGPARAGL